MTDKQILIDGVDVSGCKWFCKWNSKCSLFDCPYGGHPQCDNGELYDCDHKQLKRKEKSEEKLIKQIQTICDFINNRPETFKGINGSVDKIITDYAERKEQECKELKEENEDMKMELRDLYYTMEMNDG